MARHVIPTIRGTANATTAEAELAYWLARWIEEQEIVKGEIADAVAGSLIVSGGMDWAVREFGDGTGSALLRDAAIGLADGAEQTLAQWVKENADHGHLREDLRR